MKTLSVYFGLILLNAVVCYHAQGQVADQPDSTKKELDRLMGSKDPSDQRLLNERLGSLAASNTETDLSIAASYYYQLKNMKAFDAVCTAAVIKFPKGLQARLKAQQSISGIKNLQEREQAYHAFIQNFPPGSYPKLPFGEDRLPYDRLRSSIAVEYAKQKNVRQANYYAGLLEADFWKRRPYGDLADAFYGNGDLANAGLYQKKAIESILPYLEEKMGNSPAANFAAKGYPEACATYAHILYRQKNYHEALKYIEMAVKAAKSSRPEFNYTHAEILTALNRNQEAYDIIEAVVRSGKATEDMSRLFKVLYVKVKGSNAGLEAYQAAIRKGVVDALRTRLTNIMVNEPAANFTMTDLQGNRVSLGELKGKVVVLDFWATWCVPCKASFPAMQMAIDKYKNDPDIRFLFIHTWERTATAAADVTAYLASMRYNFQVLMDTKDPVTKANKVVDSYNVASIPTKFVIDQQGNIRFRLTGFESSNEAAMDELSMMIDMVKAKS